MSVKITIEYPGVDEAIVALSKLVSPAAKGGATSQAAPAAGGTTVRRGRADKGQKREPYGPRAAEAKGTDAGTPADKGPATPGSVVASAVTPQAAPIPAASTEPAAPTPVQGNTVSEPDGKTPSPAPAAAATQADAQKALEALFEAKGMESALGAMSRFGVKRLRDMKPEHFGEFTALAKGVVAGTAQL